MQAEIKRLQRERGLTAILVTHDQEEAMNVADRIAVMRQGRIEQIASPEHIYDRPASLFVNGFVGAANLLPGTVIDGGAASCTVRLDAGARLTVATFGTSSGAFTAGRRVAVSIRPEHLVLFTVSAADRWPVQLRASSTVGGSLRQELVATDGTELIRLSTRTPQTADTLTQPISCGLRDGDCANVFPLD